VSAPLPRHRRGFTLLEVVIAIAVLTIMAALAWETIGGAMRARDYLAFEEELDRSGRIAMARVHRELSLAFLTKNTAAVNTYRTVFVGKDDNDTDQIWFAGGNFPWYKGINTHWFLHQPLAAKALVPRRIDYAPTCFVLVHRSVFEKIGLSLNQFWVSVFYLSRKIQILFCNFCSKPCNSHS
jgi:prepilin-type N-terminal cleavage/methylation domain-containing protein